MFRKKTKEEKVAVVKETDSILFKIAWERYKARLGKFLGWFFTVLTVLLLLSGGELLEAWWLLLLMGFFVWFGFYFGRLYGKNHTYVRVGEEELSVYHGPLRYWGAHTMKLSDIQTLEVRHRSHRTQATNTMSSRMHFYDVYIIRKSGRAKLLSNVSHFIGETQAQAFATQLQQAIDLAKLA